jgi:hypothetical protein
VTDRRAERDAERRARRKAAARLQEERRLRFEELRRAWLRNHPSEDDEKRPKRGRPA